MRGQGPDQLELLVAAGLGRPRQPQQPVGGAGGEVAAHGRGQETGQAGGDTSQQTLDDRGMLLHAQRPQGRVEESGGGELAVAHHVPGRGQDDGARQGVGEGLDVLEAEGQ